MLGLTHTAPNAIALAVVIAAMALVIAFNRQVARVTSYLSMRSSPRFVARRVLIARIILVLWAATVITYSLLWLLGLVNPDA